MNTLAQSTHARLSSAIAAAPGAMQELMARHNCTVVASPESLALLAQVQGDSFTDDLFIVLAQAEQGSAGRFAAATGVPGSTQPVSQQRSALGAGLQSIFDFLKKQLTVNAAGSGGGVDYSATNDQDEIAAAQAPRIMGLSQPVFILGTVAVLLAVILLLVRHYKK